MTYRLPVFSGPHRGCRHSSAWLAGLLALASCILPVSMCAADAKPASFVTLDPARVVILGDSLTAGYGLEDGQAYPAILERKLIDAHLDQRWMIINAGVSGDTSADGLHRLAWILRQPVAILVIALGSNDGLRGLNPSLTETNLQAIIEQTLAKYPKARIVIAGMLMPPNMGPDYATAFAAVFPRLAERNHAILIPFLLADVAGKVDVNQADGIHPSADGAKLVANTVWKILLPLLNTGPAASAP